MLRRLTLVVAVGIGHQASQPAADLRPGMQLVYSSNGADQPAWSVDSVDVDLTAMPNARCARFLLRRRPDQSRADESRLCVAGDTLYGWSARREAWVPQRPVGPGMSLTTRSPSGDTVRYSTGTKAQETISGYRLTLVETTVTTVDSLGRPKRRLRERYALSLATATGGTFEAPDPASPGGWRAEQVFELRAIRPER